MGRRGRLRGRGRSRFGGGWFLFLGERRLGRGGVVVLRRTHGGMVEMGWLSSMFEGLLCFGSWRRCRELVSSVVLRIRRVQRVAR